MVGKPPFKPRRAAALLALVCASCTTAPHDSDEPETFTDLIHSDLPLFRAGENVWPKFFQDNASGDLSFGCTTRVAMGEWELKLTGGEESSWLAFWNYGAFHCFTNVSEGWDREELETASSDLSYFVHLTTTNDGRELWAIQKGFLPGSDFTLLARAPGDGVITSFDVLQSECPANRVRDGGSVNIALTRYCAINSAEELTALARRMAKRPPLGVATLTPTPP